MIENTGNTDNNKVPLVSIIALTNNTFGTVFIKHFKVNNVLTNIKIHIKMINKYFLKIKVVFIVSSW